jgi:hypothetical protein
MQDPKALLKPWSTTFHFELRPQWELGEISCSGDYLEFNSSKISKPELAGYDYEVVLSSLDSHGTRL